MAGSVEHTCFLPLASPMKLKRTTPDEMFAIVQKCLTAHPGPLGTDEALRARFFVVQRYNAVLRADREAIRGFFSYMSLGGSRRAAAFSLVLQAASVSKLALRAARKAGIVQDVLDTAPYPGVRWNAVDALVAEWQFVACFSLPEGSVTHCLAHPKYERCLFNEVEARREVAGTVRVPELLASYPEWPSGYTERIVRGRRKVSRGDAHFERAQAMMLKLYARTQEEVELDAYLNRLEGEASQRYGENADVASLLARLVGRVKELDALAQRGDPKRAGTISLVRCHGDLNHNQVVVEDGTPHLIDWSESQTASVTHDLFYTAVFHLGWRDFGGPLEAEGLETLREGLRGTLHRYSPALLAGLMLAEVAMKQHVDFNEGRGTSKRWVKIVDRYLETPLLEEAASLIPASA